MKRSDLFSKTGIKSMQAARLLLLAAIFTLLIFALSLFFSLTSYNDFKKVVQQTNNITELKGEVLQFDEVLTMSARMASVTGDLYWEKRYNTFNLKLETTLNQLTTIIPELFSSAAAKKTQTANAKLVKIEKQAFEAIKMGKLGLAQSLLTNSAYVKQKKVYTEGMLQVGKDLDDASEKMIKKQKSQLIILISILIIVIPLLILTWFITYRKFKNLIKNLTTKNQQLDASNQQLIASKKALKESEEKFQKIIYESFAGISVTNEEGKIIVWNNALEKITGIKSTETIDKYIWDVQTELLDRETTSTKRKEEIKSSLLNVLKTGNAPWLNIAMERDYIHPDGSVKIISGNMYTIKTQKGYIVVSVSNDITESKLAEEKLKDSEELFSKAFRSSPIAITITDQKTGKFLRVNQAWISIYEYKEEEAIGKTAVELQIIDEKIRLQIIDELKTKGTLQNVEMQLRNKSGSYKWILYSTESIVLGGLPCVLSTGIDITDRKKAEEAYKEAQSNLQALLDNRKDSIWALDRNYNFLVYNKPYADVIFSNMGIRLEKGMNALEIHPKEVNAFWKPKFDEVFNGNYVTFEFSYALDGKEHFFEVFMNPIYTDNKVSGLSALSMDITQRKLAEKELTKLSTAVKQSPSIIAITDTDGKLEYVNPKFTEITSYSLEEVIGQNPRVLKSGEQPDEMYKALWETISSGKTWRGEMHNKKKNGELFWEMASVSPIFDAEGKIVNYIKVAEDITERKQAENNFKNSIDESPLGIRIVNQTGKTIYVNKALLAIYAFSSPDEFLNTKAKDRYTEQSYQEHQERKKIRQEGGVISDYEISIRRKNGENRDVQVWRKEVIWNREKHFQVINQDITDLKRLNTDLILAKEKAEESNRLKSAFLSNMSHEIRTPMNGILGFTGLLKEPQLTGDEKDQFIQIIEKSGNRMLNTINDIIDISKIESGQVEVVNSEVSVNEILKEQFKFFYQEVKSKGLELNYKLSLTDNESRIVTDKHKLEGILTNLIKNAIKFTISGSISFGYETKKHEGREFLEFYVKDTGIGIPANRIEAIFNRFEQADITDARAFQGSGLGLAISKSYVEMLGGDIHVSSKEREGATFTFNIPYTKQNLNKGGVKHKKEESGISLKDLSVIVAEDDATSRMFLETILKSQVKSIIFTSTGKETIEKFRKNPDTDIILMDVKMPEMNGYDAVREIRKFNTDVVIIAQTAFGLAGEREKALEAGCNDYIAKPIKKELLFEKIRLCLDKKKS